MIFLGNKGGKSVADPNQAFWGTVK